jgi:amino acid adenylation domain-containing protein
MTILQLLEKLETEGLSLSLSEQNKLVVKGTKAALGDPAIVSLLRDNKDALVHLLQSGEYLRRKSNEVDLEPNRIPKGCEAITPEMLPLVKLSVEEIARIVERVPGGAANVQDIYPLAPLQEGILFHHLLAAQGDPYLLSTQFAFDSRKRLDNYLLAVQAVIDRHDILRTAVRWEGIVEPVQVVWRRASLSVEEVDLDPAAGNLPDQLYERFNPRHSRLDVSHAPLIRSRIVEDKASHRWLLLLQCHHLIADHVTLEVLQEEVQVLLSGKAALLPKPLPFRNLVAQARLGVSMEKHEAFFRQMLEDVEEPTAPFGLREVQGDGSQIQEARLILDRELARRIREQARKLGVSSASLFHVAWARVMGKASGREDVVFGTLLFGRGRLQGPAGAERMIGPMINTLPARIQVDQSPLKVSVRRTHELLTGLIGHEYTPLAQAQRCSGVPAGVPLFSALLNYRHSRSSGSTQKVKGIELLQTEERTNYPLSLSVDDLGEGFWLTIRVVSSLRAEQIGRHMETVLVQLVEALEMAPDTPVCNIEVLTAQERRLVLDEWNRTASTPLTGTFIDEFERQVMKNPDTVAVTYQSRHLTYGELNEKANQLAHLLILKGVRPERNVGLYMERSLELVIGIIGILKAGGAFLPLDLVHPTDRIAFMLEDAKPLCVLTAAGSSRLSPSIIPTLQLDSQAVQQALAGQSKANPDTHKIGLLAEHPAYIIYTSGSTGKAKGVIVEHRNLMNYLGGSSAFLPSRHFTSTIHSSVSFDLTYTSFFTPLFRGGSLSLLDASADADIQQLAESLDSYPDRLVKLTPRHLSILVTLCKGSADGQLITVTGGESISPDLVEQWKRLFPKSTMINHYGPTETTVGVCTYPIPVHNAQANIPIGRPIGNTQIYVLDRRMEPVPVGVEGELYIAGAGLARGYLKRPDLTAERFITNRYGAAGSRMYRTGDLARYLPDGNLEFLGRVDHQVKIRGFRIELGEIEGVLSQQPAIASCAVMAREEESGDKRLVAYVVPASGGTIDAEELRRSLGRTLPEYMVPAAFVELERLPLTRNGKLDRRALRAPEWKSRQYEAPQGEVETHVAGIWAQVLRAERVGRDDNFFAMGGHSLLATRVVSQLRQQLGVELALRTLFEAPTVAGFAVRVLEEQRAATGLRLPPLVQQIRPELPPLSYAQERLWVLEQLGLPGGAYTIPAAVRLNGGLDKAALEQAFSALVKRHETLRTRFASREGVPYQRIDEPAAVPLELIDLRGLESAEQEREVRQLAQKQASARFDLGQGPLLRAQLLRLNEQEHVLLLAMHHIVSDGWSRGVLIEEIAKLYTGFASGEPVELKPLPVQYADYTLWQRSWLKGEVRERERAYWRQQLEGSPQALELLPDHRRPAVQSFRGAHLPVALSPELSGSLEKLARNEGVTLFMVLLSAFQLLLSRWSGQENIVVGSPIANRTQAVTEGLIGFFVNMLALRAELGVQQSFRQLLAQVRERTLGAYAHQDLPFEQVVEMLKPERDLSRQPVFQAVFALQNTPRESLQLHGLQMRALGDQQITSKFDLTLALTGTVEGLRGSLEYATDLFEASTMASFARQYERVLAAIAANPGARIGEIELLSSEERRQLLYEWNETAAAIPNKAVIDLFEEQVLATPEAVAVIYEETSLTYGELNRRANRLAHLLMEKGVGSESIVGICMERSPEMIIGLLGILKAGGAYLPLDHDYPSERLAFMIEDARPLSVLTAKTTHDSLSPATSLLLLDAPEMIAVLNAQPESNPAGKVRLPQHPAYVIYTSGSTGKPKGIVVGQNGIVRLVRNSRYIQIHSEERVAQASNVSFDAATFEIWGSLLNGGCLIGISKEELLSPAVLDRKLKQHNVGILFVTTALFNQIARHKPEAFSGLRCLLFGGELVDPNWVARILHDAPPQKLVHVYGPTETVTFATWHEVAVLSPDKTIPIGRPISNMRSYVLDKWMEPVPVSVAGELYIAGTGLAHGYLNRSDLTAERFIANPYEAPGSRMYRTGDVVRYLPDGNLEFLGRVDDQVKIRGFRIELGEIERALIGHAEVAQSVVIVREDNPGDRRLAAYVVPAEGAKIDIAELRNSLGRSLPEYMVPSAFVELEYLPLNQNGKLDRRALPVPEWKSNEYEAPIGEIETRMAAIWAQELGVEKVGRHDNFFAMGGHSLLGIRLVSQLRQQLNIELSLRTLFEAPTLARLATVIGTNTDGSEVSVQSNRIPEGCEAIIPEMLPLVKLNADEIARIVERVPGGAANVQDIYPLAPLQEGYLFHHLLDGEGDPYLLSMQLAIYSRAQVESYLQALQALIDRHDILRTAVHWEGLVEPVQVVWRRAKLFVEEVELDPVAGDLADQLEGRFNLYHSRIDVRQAPMVRIRIAKDKANRRWLLLQQYHHLVSDHVTLEVLQEEIQAHLEGKAAELPKPVSFRNLVGQARLDASAEEHEAFFRKMLGDVEEPTAPFGLREVQGDGSQVEQLRRMLDRELARKIREQARKLRVSTASLFHVAWAQVLGKASDREDVVFGTVLFGRMQGMAGFERMVGPMINTLPIRIQVDRSTVEASVRRTHELLTELIGHEHAVLAQVRHCSALPPGVPLFTALLNYRHSKRGESAQKWGGIVLLRSNARTNYPLILSVDDLGEDFQLTIGVVSSLSAERISRNVETALARLVEAVATASSETPVCSIEVVSPEERQQLLYEWNDTAVTVTDKTVVDLFEEQVEKTPEAVALAYKDRSLTYAELNRRANQLAHFLIEKGVGPETIVGICMERRLEMVIGLLGILKAGGAYMPMDPSYPSERIAFMLEDASPQCVLATERAMEVLPLTTQLLRLDEPEIQARLAAQGDSNPERLELKPHNPVFVIYTSGSTGKPKGVVTPHGGLTNYLRWSDRSYYQEQGSGSPTVHSFGFSGLVTTLYGPLLAGQTLRLLTEGEEAESISSLSHRDTYTLLKVTPSHLKLVNHRLNAGKSKSPAKALMMGGEALVPSDVAYWQRNFPGVRLISHFGSSETTTGCCSFEIIEDVMQSNSIPIGRPVDNTQIYVLDSRMQPVPVGATGELYIAGAGLARGYLNRPDLTAERFIANPYGTAGSRLYRGGDLVRYRPDGNLEFLGRADHQVKIRGFRIELGEIERVLSQQPLIASCAVIAWEEQPGDKRLVAYVVSRQGGKIDVAGLRASLSRSLPEYMVPAAFVELKRLPLMKNGKLDRRALPAPVWKSWEYESPQGEVETQIANIWARVLGVEKVGRHDNFFAMGGHSLMTTRVVSQLRQQLGVELALRTLFESPTVGEFAVRVMEEQRSDTGLKLPALVQQTRPELLPLSYAQERLWFLEQLGLPGGAYTSLLAVRVNGPLKKTALEQAFSALVERHESLRTRFAIRDRVPCQLIDEPAAVHLQLIDLSGLESEEQEHEVRQLARKNATTRFDLEQGPLLRIQLLCLRENEHVLLVAMHHLITDGWSMGVLIAEAGKLYIGFASGEPVVLKALPVQYADYTLWQRSWLKGEMLERQQAYWRQQLEGASQTLQLPTDRPRPAVQSFRGAQLPVALSRELSDSLEKLARSEGVTLFMVLLSAFQLLLSRWSGQEDIVVGSPIANRTHAAIEGLIGFFANTLALRAEVGWEQSFRHLLSQVRERTLGAYEHQDLPFGQILEMLKSERDLKRQPVFQVVFALQNTPRESLRFADLQIHTIGSSKATAKFDLTLAMTATAEGLRGTVEYATDLFDASTIVRFAQHYERVLATVAANPEQRIGEIELLSSEERDQLLYEWNKTAVAIPDKTVMDLFEEQAENTPEAVALIYKETSLSYGELNRRANHLAHLLLKWDVGPETIVGVCMERSPEMIVGLLGILKTGGAYLPLDPTYPRERLAFMIEDARPQCVITAGTTRQLLSDTTTMLDLDEILTTKNLTAGAESKNVPRRTKPEHPVYITYTSGSTGQPKGVILKHEGLTNLISWHVKAFELSVGKSTSNLAGFSFDAVAWEIWPTLSVGATLHLPSSKDTSDPEALLAWWNRQSLDVTFLPTPLAELALTRKCVNANLQTLLIGGDHLAHVPSDLRSFAVVNNYGPTESTVVATSGRIDTDYPISIGGPISNIQAYVLDVRMEPVPLGLAGELYIAGTGLARGYLNHFELTAQRFVANPYGVPGTRMYRTGDLARYLPDGKLDFLGRVDQQVKIRGYRIELGEIERLLSQHSSIVQCAVIAREDDQGGKSLVAYVVPVSGRKMDAAELAGFLGHSLPGYMLPAAIVELEQLPLTRNGKLDRKALPAPEWKSHEYEAPIGDFETGIAAICAQMLGLGQVGRHDNFFEIGAHSLLAVRLVDEIRRRLGVELTLRALFEAPTVAMLAKRVENKQDIALKIQENLSIDPLFCFRRNGNLAPLFCVHPIGTRGWNYQNLVPYIPSGHPVYGLQTIYANINKTFSNLEEIATYYVTMIRAIQPSGPYLLFGWSLAGLVVYEMATQLEAAGEDIALLVVVDTYPDESPQPFEGIDQQQMLELLLQRLDDESATSRFLSRPLSYQAIADWLKRKGDFPDIDVFMLEMMLPNIAQHTVMLRKYARAFRPNELSADMTLFVAGELKNDLAQRWKQYVRGQLDIQAVAASHMEMTSTDSFTRIGPIMARKLDQHFRKNKTVAIDELRVDTNGG